MPKYRPVTFNAQPVEKGREVLGHLVAAFFTRKQRATFRNFVDDDKYERSQEWRGEYQEMAKAMVNAVDGALQGQRETN